MERFEGPTDVFGIGLYYSITSKMQADSKYQDFINNLTLNILLDLDYYPIMIKFKEKSLEITREIEKADVILRVSAQDFLEILDEKTSIIRLFLRRRLKFKKGLLKILKVYKIFSGVIS